MSFIGNDKYIFVFIMCQAPWILDKIGVRERTLFGMKLILLEDEHDISPGTVLYGLERSQSV